MGSMKTYLKFFAAGVGLLVVGAVAGTILTLASMLFTRPVKSTLACYTLQSCPGGSATIARWRGFPFGITETPAAPFQDCDIIDCYPYFHGDSAVIDICVWTLVSYAFIGFVVIGIKNGDIMDSNNAAYITNRDKAHNQ